MRDPGALHCIARGFILIGIKEHDHRCEPHDATVTGGARVARSSKWISSALEATEGLAHGRAYVETPAVTAHAAFTPPPNVASSLIGRVEPTAFDQTRSEAQRHRRVVRPLAWAQTEWPPADHIREWRKRAARPKLYGCADGIASREADETTAKAIAIADGFALGHPRINF